MIKTQILEAIQQMPNSDRLEVIELSRLSSKNLRYTMQQLVCCDRLIDAIVYRIYGLTEEEIAIVEGKQVNAIVPA